MSVVKPSVFEAELTNIDCHRCTSDSNTFSIKLVMVQYAWLFDYFFIARYIQFNTHY